MAEHDLTADILRRIQSDLAEIKANMEQGFARIEAKLVPMDEIRDRLRALEEQARQGVKAGGADIKHGRA